MAIVPLQHHSYWKSTLLLLVLAKVLAYENAIYILQVIEKLGNAHSFKGRHRRLYSHFLFHPVERKSFTALGASSIDNDGL